jgi:hypothetical protein
MPRLKAGSDAMFWKKIIKRSLLIFFNRAFFAMVPFVRWSDDHLIFRQWVDPNNPDKRYPHSWRGCKG